MPGPVNYASVAIPPGIPDFFSASLARVSLDLSGRAPTWQRCLGYPGAFDPDHFKGCIEGASTKNTTCPDLIDSYRRGLMAADRFGQLPRGYRNPDCNMVAAAMAAPEPKIAVRDDGVAQRQGGSELPQPWQPPPEWVKCLKYNPENVSEHIKQCVGPKFAGFTTCEDVQRTYEQNLRAAYNGLPDGYVRVTCPEANTIVALGAEELKREAEERERRRLAQLEQRRRQAEEQRRREAERTERYGPAPASTPVSSTRTTAQTEADASGAGIWVLLAAIGVAVLLIWLWLSRGKIAGDRIGRGGSARFANLAELKAAQWQPGRFLLGEVPRELSRSQLLIGTGKAGRIQDDDRHVFLVAQTGAGKGASIIIPNLIEWRGSALVIDPKGENATLTAMRRGRQADANQAGSSVTECLGQDVFILDPYGIVAGPARHYVGDYNPLAGLDIKDDGVGTAINMIAEAIVVSEKGKGQHFSDNAQALLAGVIEYVLHDFPPEEHTLVTVRSLLLGGFKDLQWKLGRVKTRSGLAAEAAAIIQQVGGEEGGGLYTTLSRNLRWLADTNMQDHLSAASSFSLAALKDGMATVYVVLPPKLMALQRRWLRLITNMALLHLQSRLHPKDKPQCLFVLDEFPLLGHLHEIEIAAGLMRGYGLKLLPAIQNIGQLKDHYPANWETFLGNAGAIITFGLNDLETQKYISERLGKYERADVEISTTRSTSTSNGPRSSRTTGTTEQVKRQFVDLRTPDEVQRDTARETLRMYVIRADGYPFLLNRVPYFSLYKPDRYEAIALQDLATSQEQPPAPPKEPRKATMAREAPQPAEGDGQDDPLRELERLVGLASVKRQIADLTAFVRIQQLRKERGLSAATQSYHLILTGNPGTGKTTVARIIGRIYQHLGILKKGHLIEVGRSDLVAEYLGQTAPKVMEAVARAMDGILFIDEAYMLTPEDNRDMFGQEAVDTLLKQMEDNRDRLVVIAAGYKDDMDRFVRSNPGLESRFKTFIDFPDYLPTELMQIFRQMCDDQQYMLTPDAEAKLLVLINAIYEQRQEGFGNGRAMRNLYEKITLAHARRIESAWDNLSDDDLITLTQADIPEVETVA